MNYRIIERSSAGELERAVREHLRSGWRLQGGVCVTAGGVAGCRFYHQALTCDPPPVAGPHEPPPAGVGS